MNSISANLNIMIKASEKASKILIRDFGEIEKLQVSVKGPSDFVSSADTKVEKIIIEELSKARKNFSIISEESGTISKKDKKSKYYKIGLSCPKCYDKLTSSQITRFTVRHKQLLNKKIPLIYKRK